MSIMSAEAPQEREVPMNHRFLVIAVALLVTVPAAGQVPSTKAKAAPAVKTAPAATKWTPSRTPDGQPDLQGFWTNSTYVPLERPKNVSKEFYTPAEAAEAEKKAADRESE